MTKVLVFYHSSYGHVESLAEAIAEGARSVEGVEVRVKRVPETMGEDAMRAIAVFQGAHVARIAKKLAA